MENQNQRPEELPISFSAKLARKFSGKDGKDYMSIKVPELNWGQFVVPADKVHVDKKNENFLYTYLLASASVTLTRSVKQADETYKNVQEKVSAQQIFDAFQKKERTQQQSQETAKEEEQQTAEAEAEAEQDGPELD